MNQQQNTSACPLTRQELRVMELSVRGTSVPQIACELQVSIRTVQYHFGNIYKALKVKDRASANALCLREGWVSL